jgi:hypothetical protein
MKVKCILNFQVRHNNYLPLQYVKSRAKQYVITLSGGASVNNVLLMKTGLCRISVKIMVLYDVKPYSLVGRYQLCGIMPQKKMEAASSSKMLVPFYQTTHHHMSEIIILIFTAARN